VDPVPDPPLLRKTASDGNRTRGLWICSQEVWPREARQIAPNEKGTRLLQTDQMVDMDKQSFLLTKLRLRGVGLISLVASEISGHENIILKFDFNF
jgi:hypothetical protein